MKKLSAILLVTVLMACHTTKIPVTENKTVSKTTVTTTTTTTATTNEVDPKWTKAQTKVPGITMQELENGKKLYVQNCASCHALKNTEDFTADEWEPIVTRMLRKAHISDEKEKKLIHDYVVASSK